MIYKYLFYYFSYLEKKFDVFNSDDNYISSYIIVGLTIAVHIFVVIDVVSIFILHSPLIVDIIIPAMPFIAIVMIVFSYLFFKHNNRRDRIFDEIDQTPRRKKIKYGIYCFFYIILSYGIWFICNDIMCVLNKGHGLSYAENIVQALNLTYW